MDLIPPGPDEGWTVLLIIPPEDADAIRAVKWRVTHPVHVELIEHEVTGVFELAIVTRELDIDQAIAWAQARYLRMRQLAGLPGRDAQVLGAFPGDWHDREEFLGNPRHLDLIGEASRALTDGNFEWAIVAAQAATEVWTSEMVKSIAPKLSDGLRDQALRALRPAPTLTAKRMKEVMRRILESPPQTQPWWSRYRSHVTRRHEVVHGGLRVTRSGAEESVEVCSEVVEFLEDAWLAFEQRGLPRDATP